MMKPKTTIDRTPFVFHKTEDVLPCPGTHNSDLWLLGRGGGVSGNTGEYSVMQYYPEDGMWRNEDGTGMCTYGQVPVEWCYLPPWPSSECAPPKDQKPIGEEGKTGRGFELIDFIDEYGIECSLQESSRAVCENDDGSVDNPLGFLWLGIDDANPEIMKAEAEGHGLDLPTGDKTGWMPYPVPEAVLMHTRMHLDEYQVRALVERLEMWLNTGSLLAPKPETD